MLAHTTRGNRPPSAPPLTRSVRSRPTGPRGEVVDLSLVCVFVGQWYAAARGRLRHKWRRMPPAAGIPRLPARWRLAPWRRRGDSTVQRRRSRPAFEQGRDDAGGWEA